MTIFVSSCVFFIFYRGASIKEIGSKLVIKLCSSFDQIKSNQIKIIYFTFLTKLHELKLKFIGFI